MNKNKLLAILCLASAIVLGVSSASFTANLFMSMDETNFKYVLLLVAISLDFGKFAFSAISAFQFSKEKYVSSLTYAVLAMLCIVTSFLASMSYDLNQANSIANDTITSSGAYQRQTELFKATNDDISTTKTDIATLKANRKDAEKQIRADYQQRIDNAKKLKYLTTPKIGVNDLTSERDSKISALDADIKAKESMLNSKQSELTGVNNGFGTVAGTIKTTRGVNALAAWLSPTDPDATLGKINLAKNILLEICAIAFSVGFGVLINKGENTLVREETPTKTSQLKEISTLPTPQTEAPTTIPTIPTVTEVQATIPTVAEAPTDNKKRFSTTYIPKKIMQQNKDRRTIGFHANDIGTKTMQDTDTTNVQGNIGINQDEVKIYLDYMYRTAKNNVSTGYMSISKNTDLTVEGCRKIKGFLERHGVIETVGSRTVILKDNWTI